MSIPNTKYKKINENDINDLIISNKTQNIVIGLGISPKVEELFWDFPEFGLEIITIII